MPTDNNSRFIGPPYDAVKYARIDYWLCGVMEKKDSVGHPKQT